MNVLHDMIPRVRQYLQDRDWSGVPVMCGRTFRVQALAQGEYNLNYLIGDGDVQLVFRVNMGTQIDRDDQILYEYKALELLQGSGVTPLPYFVDDSRTFFDRGILIMSFLSGEPLNYHKDLDGAAGLFAGVHQIQVPPMSKPKIV